MFYQCGHCPHRWMLPLLWRSAHESTQSAECKVWFDEASIERMRWRRVSEFMQNRNITQLIRDVAQRLMNGHPNLQESSALSRNVIPDIEQSVFEDKSISAFKYIRFDTCFPQFVRNRLGYYPRTYLMRWRFHSCILGKESVQGSFVELWNPFGYSPQSSQL